MKINEARERKQQAKAWAVHHGHRLSNFSTVVTNRKYVAEPVGYKGAV